MLYLNEPGPALADRFLEGELSDDEVGAHPVLSRWARSARLGVRADSAALPEGATGGDLATRRDRLEAVFREESSLLSPVAGELSARSMLAIVADPEGVILLARGGGEFTGHASRVRLSEGTRWSEGARGTNAIGTAILERRPVAVIGRAHYEERNRGLFCYATPICDPYGEMVAVLDVTGAADQHSPAVGIAVQAAGAALERALKLREYAVATPGGYAVIERMLLRTSAPAILAQADGSVPMMNPSARAALGLPDDHATLTVERVFGTSAQALQAMALSPRQEKARFETRTGRYRMEIEPVVGSRGRLLSFVIYLLSEGSPAGRITTSDAQVVSKRPPGSTAAPRGPVALPPAFDAILGTDPDLVAGKQMAARFARTPLPVLLLAETGTGKELFARAIHAASPRAKGPFVALNCGGLAPSLLESELFGHAPGAFTGAQRGGSMGKLAAADGGTLFLDEIAEMPSALQATLLRVLEDGSYYRVGEARARRADFRLICATCRDLPRMVSTGAFRRDLFFRIQGATVKIPPLRDRADRLALAHGLLQRLSAESNVPCPELADDAVTWLLSHDWPGNVRELKSALAHALVMSDDSGVIDVTCFPTPVLFDPPASSPLEGLRATDRGPDGAHGATAQLAARPKSREEILEDAMDSALREAGGNVSEAARRLGVARSTLYRRAPRRGG